MIMSVTVRIFVPTQSAQILPARTPVLVGKGSVLQTQMANVAQVGTLFTLLLSTFLHKNLKIMLYSDTRLRKFMKFECFNIFIYRTLSNYSNF